MADTDSENPYINQSIYQQNGLIVPVFEATSTNYRNAHRNAILGDQDSIVAGEYTFLQSRCRYMIRNNPTASAARDKHVTTSGAIRVKWHNKDGSEHTLATELWGEFEENPSLDGKGNLTAIQAT